MDLMMILQLLKGAAITLQISLVGVIFGTLFGVIFGSMSSRRVAVPIITPLIGAYVYIIRGTPLFIQLLIAYYAIPQATGLDLGPLSAGILTLCFNSAAYVTETVRGSINAIPSGQWEACHVLGYSQPQALQYIILPQALKNALPALTNEFVTLIKESSILMMIGVPELTKSAKDIVARELNPMEIYLGATLMYLLMTSVFSKIAQYFEGEGDD